MSKFAINVSLFLGSFATVVVIGLSLYFGVIHRWDSGDSDGMGSLKVRAIDEPTRAAIHANLQRIGVALRNYESKYKSFPAGSQAGPNEVPHSWRVSLLPFLGLQQLYDQYRLEEPWDSPANLKVLQAIPEVYQGRSRGTASSVLAFVGSRTIIANKACPSSYAFDGVEGTICAVSVASDVPWTKPEDIPIELELDWRLSAEHGLDVLFASTATAMIRGKYPARDFYQAILRDDDIKAVWYTDSNRSSILSPLASADVKDDRGIDNGQRSTPQAASATSSGGSSSSSSTTSSSHTSPSTAILLGNTNKSALYNLKLIGIALHSYESDHHRFPDAVQIGPKDIPHSWRVSILPYLGLQELYKQYKLEEPWDSPNNSRVLKSMPTVYQGLSEGSHTSVMGFVGPETSFGKSLAVLSRGSDLTVMAASIKTEIPWTKPEDIAVQGSQEDRLPELNGLSILYASGNVFQIQGNYNPKDLFAGIRIHGDADAPWDLQDRTDPDVPIPDQVFKDLRGISFKSQASASSASKPASTPGSIAPSSIAPSPTSPGPTSPGPAATTTMPIIPLQPLNDPASRYAPKFAGLASVRNIEKSLSNLRSIGLALKEYERIHHHFPSAVIKSPFGQMYSWRVAMLPYLGQKELYDLYKFDEPWNSVNNLKVMMKMPDVYRDNPIGTDTAIVAFVGENTIIGRYPTEVAAVKRGLPQTIAVAAMRTDIPWTKPDDIPIEKASDFKVPIEAGLPILYGDGTTQFIPQGYRPEDFYDSIHRESSLPAPWKRP